MEDRKKIKEVLWSDVPVDEMRLTKMVDYNLRRTKKTSPLLWIGLAACVLLAAGLSMYQRYPETKVVPQKGRSNIAMDLPHTDADFIVLKANPEQQIVSVQSFDDFTIKEYTAGSVVDERYVLVRVNPGAVILQNESGTTREYPLWEWNSRAMGNLQLEVEACGKVFGSGALTVKQVDRLAAIAFAGHANALSLLEQIKERPGSLGSRAETLLSNQKALRHIESAARIVREGSRQYQWQALQALGRTDSPLAVCYLRDLALGLKNKELAVRCVELIAERNSIFSLGALEEIEKDAIISAARQRAKEIKNEILKIENGTADERKFPFQVRR